MIDRINELIATYDPRVVSQKIKSQHKDVYQWILANTPSDKDYKSFKERVYCALNQGEDIRCEYDKEKKFVSLSKGYGFCGSLKSCECHKSHLQTYQKDRDTDAMAKNREATWMKKYGVKNPMLVKSIAADVHKKRVKTSNSKVMLSHGYNSVVNRVQDVVTPNFTETEYNGCGYRNRYGWTCTKCNHIFEDHIDSGKYPRCEKCYPKTVSKGEKQIAEFIKSLGIDIQENVHHYDINRELDIFIPSHNLGIEFNGVYWHSDIHKSKNYHLEKSKKFSEKNIRVIHIWSDEWESKREIVENRLRSILKAQSEIRYARKCTLKEIEHNQYKEFCNRTHLRGWAPAAHKYGLFYSGELVAVMSFSASRYTKTGYELVRYCSLGNVVGGAGKLFSYFIKHQNPDLIITYADRSWNTGNLYLKLGFSATGCTNPGYWYVNRNVRYHRSSFQKNKLVREGYDSTLTEQEIMKSRGFTVVYDCGHFKYIWKKP